MSEKLCTLRTQGGGGLKETALWTNSAPTSVFANQTITLSDDLTKYDYLKVSYRVSTSISTESYVIIPVDTFKNYTGSQTNTIMYVLQSIGGYAYMLYQRSMAYTSPTQMTIGGANLINYGNNTITTGQNSRTIPISVIGCKFK